MLKNRLIRILYGLKIYFRTKDAVFWSIAWPLIWLILSTYIFMPPSETMFSLRIAVIDNDQGLKNLTATLPPFSENITSRFTDIFLNHLKLLNKTSKITYYVKVFRNICSNLKNCLTFINNTLIKEEFHVAILIPRNATLNYVTWVPVKLLIYVKASSPSEEFLRFGSIMIAISNFNVNKTLHRINQSVIFVGKYVRSYTKEFLGNVTFNVKNFTNYIKYHYYGIAFPLYPNITSVKPKVMADRAGLIGWASFGAIGLSVMTGLLVSSAGFFAFNKENGRLRIRLSSPLKISDFIINDVIESIIITGITSLIILLTGILIGGRIIFDLLNLSHYIAFSMIFITALFAYGLGLLIAPTIKSPKAASGIAALGLMFIFLTGIWWPPKELLPEPLKVFATLFPPSCAFDVVRDILVWGKGIYETLRNIAVSACGTALIYVLIFILYRGRFEKFAERILS